MATISWLITLYRFSFKNRLYRLYPKLVELNLLMPSSSSRLKLQLCYNRFHRLHVFWTDAPVLKLSLTWQFVRRSAHDFKTRECRDVGLFTAQWATTLPLLSVSNYLTPSTAWFDAINALTNHRPRVCSKSPWAIELDRFNLCPLDCQRDYIGVNPPPARSIPWERLIRCRVAKNVLFIIGIAAGGQAGDKGSNCCWCRRRLCRRRENVYKVINYGWWRHRQVSGCWLYRKVMYVTFPVSSFVLLRLMPIQHLTLSLITFLSYMPGSLHSIW